MLTAVAAFAESFANPLAPVLVLGLALLLTSANALRLAAAVVGGLLALPHLPLASTAEVAWLLLGSIAAPLLYVELTLHFVMPGLRFAKRCLVVARELIGITAMMLPQLRRRALRRRPGDEPPTPEDQPRP